MYYSIGGPGNKSTLELDDVAALVYGYPRSTVRIRVLDGGGTPIAGAQVELLGTASPVNGSDEYEGGSVYGDIAASSFGDGIASDSYHTTSPFTNTSADGYTNYIMPLHPSFQVRISKSELTTFTRTVTPAEGTSTVTISSSETPEDPSDPSDPPEDPPVNTPASSELLWTRSSDGLTTLWALDDNGDAIGNENYGPQGTGWTATSYQKNADGTAQLLWSRSSDGLSAVWMLDADGKRTSYQVFRQSRNWTATSYQKNADGTAQLLWSRPSDGLSVVWMLDANGRRTSYQIYRQAQNWMATSYQKNGDGTAQLLWSRSSDGLSVVWMLNAGGNRTSYQVFRLSSGWTANSYQKNVDGTAQLLWSRSGDGLAVVWMLNASGNRTSYQIYRTSRLGVGRNELRIVLHVLRLFEIISR